MKFWYDPESDSHLASKNDPGAPNREVTIQQYFAALHPGMYCYDIECYPNVFTVTVYRVADGGIWRFEISDRINQGVEFFQFLTSVKHSGGRMVGFVNEGYDYIVIHELVLKGGHVTAPALYEKSYAIFNDGDRFGHMIWESDRYIPQVDVFKIHHFDNKSRGTSLKMLEFNMRSKSIQDLPFTPGTYLTHSQIDELIPYNDHDVFETVKFLGETISMIEFRDNLSGKYGRDFTNHNDTKLGKEYFIMELERLGVPCYHWPNGKREPRQTLRPTIDLGSVILPWIRFDRPEFNMVMEWLKNQTITRTKGVFEYINVPPEMAMCMLPHLIRVHGLSAFDLPSLPGKEKTVKKLEKGVLLSICHIDVIGRNDLHYISGWKDQGGLNCIVDGFRYIFGTGGIHGSIESQTVVSDETHVLIDLDVKSYYPNIAISNNFYPEHLGEQFCGIYQDVYNQRKAFDKGTPENAMLKLALNGVFGDSNNPYSPFYDPAYFMSITLNGQLMLCMLTEQLITIPGLSMIQINTDGLTVRCPRNQADRLMDIARSWETQTGLELERADYSRMLIRDVNNYIAEYEDGKLKRKGAYCYGDDLSWHQDYSSQIVAIAAEAALIRNVPVRDTICSHSDLMDFMLRTKVPRNSRLMIGTEQHQNITRYYISKGGGSLTKIMPPTPAQVAKDPNAPERKIGISVGWTVAPCNDLSDFKALPIDYDYYIEEAEKLVNPLTGV